MAANSEASSTGSQETPTVSSLSGVIGGVVVGAALLVTAVVVVVVVVLVVAHRRKKCRGKKVLFGWCNFLSNLRLEVRE